MSSPALSTAWTMALVLGMLFTGTINTILNKLQDLQCVDNCDDPDPSKRHYFEQPVWQTLNMFVGEAVCLVVYYIGMCMDERRKKLATGVPTERSPLLGSQPGGSALAPAVVVEELPHGLKPLTGYRNLLFWIPTLCDMTATTLMNVGLIHVSASIYQMLRGSVVLFTGTLSVIFLNRRHPVYRWFALITVFAGVAVVGMSGIVEGQSGTTAYPVKSSFVGVLLVVLAQTFTAAQFVIEEKIMCKYDVAPIKAVGLEGLFGLITTGLGLPILYYTFGIRGPKGNFFDVPEGFRQVFGFPQILWAGVGIIFSIAFFNWFGLSVTRHISATSRSTIDTCRTIFIWMISLGLGWETFKGLQVVGFVILIYGTFLFNDVISPPPCAFCEKVTDEAEEEAVEEEPAA
ncbi:hypothetical protein HK102_005686 [Quaeritorhiza haematococci]|nr:hypothetical protein HK102_005686 [Quaeritorhiza haematococci]